MKAKYNDIELEGTPEEVISAMKALNQPVAIFHIEGIGDHERSLMEMATEQMRRVRTALGYSSK